MKNENIFKLSIVFSGFSLIINQLVFIREILSVFSNNELTISITMSIWLLLTGLGSLLSKYLLKNKTSIKIFLIISVFSAIIPIISFFSLYFIRNIFFLIGEMIGLIPIITICIIILAPYCLLIGFGFNYYCNLISKNKNKITDTYILETLGSIIGGLVFSFILTKLFDNIDIILYVLILNIIFIVYISYKFNRIKFILTSAILLVIILFFVVNYKTSFYNSLLFFGKGNIYYKDTEYGKIIILKNNEQVSFFENGNLIYSGENIIESEEDVHFSMAQHSNPKNILLISGLNQSTINELLKYNVKNIDYVDIDKELINLKKKFIGITISSKLNLIYDDARIYVKKTSNKYDVIIINTGEPSTFSNNRYYTKDFFENLKQIMNKDGVLITNLAATENYVIKEALEINLVLYNTLSSCFKNVVIIPEFKNFFVSSDNNLSKNIIEKIESKKIITQYTNSYYIDNQLIIKKSNNILSKQKNTSLINSDFNPKIYILYIKHWLFYFNINIVYIYLISLIILAMPFFIYKKENIILFSTGLSGIGIEIIVIALFQCFFGNVYSSISFIFSLFTIGLCLGAIFSQRIKKEFYIKNIIINICIIIIISSIFPILTYFACYYLKTDNNILKYILYFTNILTSFTAGCIFSLITKIKKNEIIKNSSTSYGSDLVGSATGSILISILLLPIFGFIFTGIIISIINIISLYLFLHKYRKSLHFN